MAYLSRTTITPLLLTYENESMYLHIDPQGCALFEEDSTEPFHQIHEPLLLAHGIMTDSKTVHLVVLKTSGELCYTLISGPSMPQTTLIAKLDVRATIYRRLFLFPQGKIIHIFYAYSHHAMRNLWRIEHRCWNGSSWHSAHMGEVVHQQEPLYHVNLDNQGNLHLLTITFQGRHSLLFTNRFNGTFHIWGSPTETLKIPGEVVDMTALMTSDNVHHLYWIVKTSNEQFEIRWAQQTDAHELTSTWHPSPAPIKTFPSPWKNIGAIEKNGVLWLLAHTEEETLMQNDGKGWKLISSRTPFHLPLQWVHKGKKNFHQAYWLEDQVEKHAPAYYHELGIAIKKQADPWPASFQSLPAQVLPATPPPVPTFYPELLSPNSYPVQSISIPENESNSLNSSKVIDLQTITNQVPSTNETSNTPSPIEEVPESSPVEDAQPQLLKEPIQFERLASTVAHLEEENAELQDLVPTVARLEKENSELQSLIPTVALLKQENTELQSLVPAVALLQQENTELQSLVPTVALLKQENIELQSLVPTITLLKQEHAELQSLVPTVARLEKENSELQSLVPTVARLEKENSELQSLIPAVAFLKQENTELQNLIPSVAFLKQENAELQSLVPTITLLKQEHAELQSLVPTVALLEQENAELQRLISTVAHLEQENADMSLLLRNVLSRFNQVVEDLSNNSLQVNQESAVPALAGIHFNELEPVKDAMSNLEKETQSLSQVLRVMLAKQEESDSSLEKLETQLSQLQSSKEEVKNRGGFWNKWIT
ncbi:MAG: hypothetical protein P4L69_02335 [Desulfosporosinus sp.]|nr:hypothetical protein [Desulfosporosinus sp.]